ncbi:MAG: FtsX-like permease family protein [Candidatus Cloacimonetes bacterium]|nr:FtsX-like permease family protein [Candidatus Cloacimonadota bacterium]
MKKKGQILLFFVKKSFRFSSKQLRKPSTIITFGGFALSVAILTASLTLLNGYQRALKEGLLGVNAHIYLYSLIDNKLTVDEVNRITEFFHEQEEIESFAAVKMTQVMAVGERQIKGVLARSIQWQKKNLPINYHTYIIEGSGKLEDQFDAVLGSELANFLQVSVGEQINLMTPANMQYTLFGLKTGEVTINVKGIFHSGIYESDSRTVYLNDEIFSFLTTDPDKHDMIEVKLKANHIDRADYLAYVWNLMLEENYIINSWIDYNSNLFTMLVLQKWVIAIILSFLIVIASFNIISNTTTSIMERKKEIAILMAMGCKNELLKHFFLIKTTLLSLFSVIIGVGSGLLLAYLLTKQTYLVLKGDVYFIESFTIKPDIGTIVITLTLSLFIALWATIMALNKISQLTIIDIIRGN